MCKRILGCLLLLTAGAANIEAAVVTVQRDPGTTYTTNIVLDEAVTGADMSGILNATVTFSSGTDSKPWGLPGPAPGPLAGGIVAAFGNGSWSLGVANDTYNIGFWTLVNATGESITKIVLDGVSSGTRHTVFDLNSNDSSFTTIKVGNINPGDPIGTPGSEKGRTFELIGTNSETLTNSLNITVTYKNEVKLASAASAVTDVYTTLEIVFNNPGGLPGNNTFVFWADTDIIDDVATIPTNPVPEPASLAMFAGLALAGGWHIRRRRASAAV